MPLILTCLPDRSHLSLPGLGFGKFHRAACALGKGLRLGEGRGHSLRHWAASITGQEPLIVPPNLPTPAL